MKTNMIDREKVINAIECCIDGCLCAECDYEGIEGCWNKVLLTDALALLKEQEPAKAAILATDHDTPDGITYCVCPSCRIMIDYQDRYCRYCGQALSWEGGK